MQPDTILTLAQYINDLKRRDRDRDRAGEQPAFDTTTEDDAHWNPGNQNGNAGRGTNNRG